LKRKNLIKIEFWIRNSLSLRKHYSQRFVVKNSKFSTCFSIYDFEFALNELCVKDSTTNRKWCEKFVWIRFSFFLQWFAFFHSMLSNNFVKLSRCVMQFILFVDVSSSSSLQRIFISEEFDLKKKICSRNEDLYQTQNALLNL
jgi:hypothetical protein